MKLNAAGIASAFVILAAFGVFRLGDKPVFTSIEQENQWSTAIKASVKESAKKAKPKYVPQKL